MGTKKGERRKKRGSSKGGRIGAGRRGWPAKMEFRAQGPRRGSARWAEYQKTAEPLKKENKNDERASEESAAAVCQGKKPCHERGAEGVQVRTEGVPSIERTGGKYRKEELGHKGHFQHTKTNHLRKKLHHLPRLLRKNSMEQTGFRKFDGEMRSLGSRERLKMAGGSTIPKEMLYQEGA